LKPSSVSFNLKINVFIFSLPLQLYFLSSASFRFFPGRYGRTRETKKAAVPAKGTTALLTKP
jgi:hypothetical protein